MNLIEFNMVNSKNGKYKILKYEIKCINYPHWIV